MNLQIRTSSPPRLVALLLGAALFGLASQSAMAAGTASGTQINNTASLTYSVGGVSQTAVTGSVSFLVDEKINLTVTGGVTTSVLPGATDQATAFSVTNNSNSPLDFNLAVTTALGGDNFDPSSCNAYVESSVTPGYQSGEDTATFIDELAIDTSKTVYVVCNIPASATNTQTGNVGLTATARGDFTTNANHSYNATPGSLSAATPAESASEDKNQVDIVLADGFGPDDAASPTHDAKHSAHNTYNIVITVPTVTKTANVLCDPFNGLTTPKRIPGAIVQYKVEVDNPSAASITLTQISDTLDIGNVTFDPGLRAPADAATCIAGVSTSGFKIVSSNGSRLVGGTAGVMTNAADADGATFSTPNVTIDFSKALPLDAGYAAGELKPSEKATIYYNVIITTP